MAIAVLPSRDSRAAAARLRLRGFTLIELMITVAIIAIIAAIAIPSYQQYITKTRRGAAAACSLEAAQYMERFYTTNLSYDGAEAALPPAGPIALCEPGTEDHYTVGIETVSDSTYTIVATPIGVQATRDAECGTLRVTQTGAKSAIGTTSSPDRCW